ncbi:cytochrome P450 [uncultured Tateyamaria sp.]|uniref:cytochrome P450 n=1 Tax=uncultured Tateyamaria sp. TaxID=455651 RepID=UPI00260BF27D|nr:cytochrome P450 [uncultured Tateyamaria sp.]
MPKDVPHVSEISIAKLTDNPYPCFDRIRDRASAVWVDSARLNLVTRFDDIMEIERNHHIFASTNPQSLMNTVMGHSLMRKDDAPHQAERKAIEPSFRPGVVKQHFAPIFSAIADELLDGIAANGQADLFDAFAAPMASHALIELLGLDGVGWQDLARWSQALMDGVGNYGADPDIANRAKDASDAVDRVIDKALPRHLKSKNPTILSSMAHAPTLHGIDQIRANVKVIIGGGLNEPRDAILTSLHGLLSHPDQLAAVRADPSLHSAVFEEAVRWVSPIGMYPRRVTCETTLGDTPLKEGDQLGICVGAANRDPSRFTRPNDFDIHRPRQQHLAFGAGPHFCAGTWVARQMVGEIAVPRLLRRLKGLRLDSQKTVQVRGWVFRGPTSLPVLWDA